MGVVPEPYAAFGAGADWGHHVHGHRDRQFDPCRILCAGPAPRARRRAAGCDRSGEDPVPSRAHDGLGHDPRDGAHGDGLFPECAAGPRRHRRPARGDSLHPIFRALRLCDRLWPTNGSTKWTDLIMKTLSGSGTRIAFLAVLLSGLYFGYRMYEANSDAALLRDKTLEEAVVTVAVVSARPLPQTETIVLPGNIVGWYEAPIYARVTGYVKMWHKDY